MKQHHVEIKQRGWTVLDGFLNKSMLDSLSQSFAEHVRGSNPSTSQLYTHVPPDTPESMDKLMTQWLNPHKSEGDSNTQKLCCEIKNQLENHFSQDLVLFQDVLMSKSYGHLPFSWHQDYPYWPIDRPHGFVLWCPLQDTDEFNGGLGLASGSHLWGSGPPVDLVNGCPQSGSIGIVPLNLVPEFPSLKAGDALIFSPLMWHTSSQNQTKIERLAWSSSWVYKGSRWKFANAPLHPICKSVGDNELIG